MPGYPHFDMVNRSQIHYMFNKAMRFGKLHISGYSFVSATKLGTKNTFFGLGGRSETCITKALLKRSLGALSTLYTINLASITDLHMFPNPLVDAYLLISRFEKIRYRRCMLRI
jgi:hypothetical protein